MTDRADSKFIHEFDISNKAEINTTLCPKSPIWLWSMQYSQRHQIKSDKKEAGYPKLDEAKGLAQIEINPCKRS
jgi:hypothetical protein